MVGQLWGKRQELSEVSLVSYLVLALSFGLNVLIARVLGPSSYGSYAAVLAAVALIEVPLVLRGSDMALRYVGELWNTGRENEARRLASQMVVYDLWLYFIVTVVLIGGGWLSSQFLRFDPLLFTIVVFTIPVQAGFGVFKSSFVICNEVRSLARFELIYQIVLIGLSCAGVVIGGIHGLAVGLVLGEGAKNGIAYLFSRRFFSISLKERARRSGLWFARGAVGPVLRGATYNGLHQIDVILLATFYSPSVVGAFKVAKALSLLPLKAAYPVWRYLLPRVVEAVQTGDSARQRRIVAAGSGAMLAVLAVAAPFVLRYGRAAIDMIYGVEYRSAFPLFVILVMGVAAFHGLAGWFKGWVVVVSRQGMGVLVYGAGLALIAGGIVLWGRGSPLEAAAVVSGAYIFMTVCAFYLVLQ